MLTTFPQCNFHWSFQKYSVKILYAIMLTGEVQNSALWDTHLHALFVMMTRADIQSLDISFFCYHSRNNVITLCY